VEREGVTSLLDFASGQSSWTFLEVAVMQFGWLLSMISQHTTLSHSFSPST
jgi:hypothetical protein